MTEGERYAQVRTLFERLVAMAPPERRAALDTLTDPGLRDAVAALLAADEDPRDIEPLNPPPPERIAGFRVIRELGRGGMGVVYEAEEGAPRRRVALKLLHPWLRSAGVDEFARREAQALADAPHPGIPSVYALLEHERGPVVIMELVEGEPFAEALARRSFAERLELLARVADAVAYAHARGVVHRDLKPENVILGPGDQPKVLDFGLARTGDSPAAAGGGTPAYMAPEQAQGAAPTPLADLYSLGVMGREVLVGAPDAGAPLKGRPDVEAVLRRATAARPEDRYSSVADFAADLRRAAADRAVVALPGVRAWVWALGRRHPRGLLGAAALVGVLAAAPRVPEALGDLRAAAGLAALQREPAGLADPGVTARLEGLLRDPQLIGAPARVEGWAWLASGRAGSAQLTALVGAWMYADPPSPTTVSALAGALRDHGAEAAATAIEADARGRTGLAEWDFADPHVPPPLRAPLAALGAATRLPDVVTYGELDPEGAWRWSDGTLAGPGGRRVALPARPSDVVTLQHPAGARTLVGVRFGAAGLFAVDAGGVDVWAPGAAAQALPVRALEAADLDGDGADELVVGATGWRGHELRVYDGAGGVRARARFAAWDVAVTRDRTLWVIAGPRPDADRPHGERRDLLPLRLRGSTLEAAGPRLRLDREALAVWAADVDGDGVDELVLRREDGLGVVAGGEVAWVPGLRLSTRVQADGDAAIELRVHDGTADWLLGAGDDPLPARAGARLQLDAAPPGLPGARAGAAWARAAALVHLGVVEPVLPHLLDLVRASRRPAALRAPALALVTGAEASPAPGLPAFAAALVSLDADTPVDAETRTILRASHAFDGEVPRSAAAVDAMDLTAPLPRWLEVGAPGTVRRDPLRARLRVDLGAGEGLALRAAIEPLAAYVCVDTTLDVEQLDWSAGVVFAISAGGREVKTTLQRTGGGDRAGHRLNLAGPGVGVAAKLPFTLGEHRVSLCVSEDPAVASARLDDEARRLDRSAVPALDGPLTLEVRASDEAGLDASARARVHLLSVQLRGARFVDAPRGDPEARAFAESGTGAVGPRARALQASEAGADPATLLPALDDADAVWLLRRDPERWAQPAVAASDARFYARWLAAWAVPVHYRDPWAAAPLRSAALLGLPLGSLEAQAAALARAEALLGSGELGAALALLDALPLGAPGVAVVKARVAVRTGRAEEVRPLLLAALAATPAPEPVRDAFADDPELAPRVEDVPAAGVIEGW